MTTGPDLEAAAKAKSDERRAHLEAFRAAQAAKKAASLGHKGEQPATAPAKPPRSRVHPGSISQQQDPNRPHIMHKSASVSPERKPPTSSQATRLARPKSGTAAKAKPQVPLRVPTARKSQTGEASIDNSKTSSWVEGQQVFGYETSRAAESRRSSQAGELTSISLGAGFGDDGDPNTGIRWQIQMECLRLQQWRILNRRIEAALEAQQQQAEQQLRQAAEVVVALKKKLYQEKAQQEKQQHAEYATAALAAQMPRLELYATLSEEHEASMEKIKAAVAAGLQQMPLVNGATCGTSAEAADAEAMCQALRDVQNIMASLEPRLKPFLGNAQGSKENGEASLYATAKGAEALAEVDSQLRTYLLSNANLLERLEREVVHGESLAIQLLHAEKA